MGYNAFGAYKISYSSNKEVMPIEGQKVFLGLQFQQKKQTKDNSLLLEYNFKFKNYTNHPQ